jgi:hypothetical protein
MHRQQQHRPVQQRGTSASAMMGTCTANTKRVALRTLSSMRRPWRMAATMRASCRPAAPARRPARHVGAALAHGDAHVGGLERGGVVHAVAGHGHHSPLAQQLHQAQLALGPRARPHGSRSAGRRRPALQLVAGDDLGPL